VGFLSYVEGGGGGGKEKKRGKNAKRRHGKKEGTQ